MASKTGTIYVGVTDDLSRRVYEHKNKLIEGFTSKYNINRLVFFSEFSDINEAISMEKKVKGWSRQKKLALITSFNQNVKDLAEELI